MRIAVKICGLTRPEDIRAAITAGADAVGMVFDRGACRVSEVAAEGLLRAVEGAEIERVAVVGEADAVSRRRIRSLGFDLIQVAGAPQLIPEESPHVLPAFFDGEDLEVRVADWRRTWMNAPRTREGSLRGTINVDGAGGGGTGVRADWNRAARIARRAPVVLSGGLSEANLAEAVRRVRPHAVDVSSGVEAAPGVKDPQKMLAFVKEVRRLEGQMGETFERD